MSDRQPAEIFPPGHFIDEQLRIHHWTRSDLAQKTGLPVQWIVMLINGDLVLDKDIAIKLAEVFTTSVEFWLQLEAAWRNHQFLQSQNKK